MPFRFSEEQWAAIRQRIDKLGGYEALDHVRLTIEDHLTTAFINPDFNTEMAAAYVEAHKAAKVFRDAINSLAKLETRAAAQIGDNEAFPAELAKQDAASRTEYAKFLREYTEDLRQEVSWRSGESGVKRRGRPVDKAAILLCTRILETAKHEQWIIIDDRNRASKALIDLMVDLMAFAKSADLTELIRDRRACLNAIGDARKEQERAHQASAWLRDALDTFAERAPENTDLGANCLCSVPPKSD